MKFDSSKLNPYTDGDLDVTIKGKVVEGFTNIEWLPR